MPKTIIVTTSLSSSRNISLSNHIHTRSLVHVATYAMDISSTSSGIRRPEREPCRYLHAPFILHVVIFCPLQQVQVRACSWPPFSMQRHVFQEILNTQSLLHSYKPITANNTVASHTQCMDNYRNGLTLEQRGRGEESCWRLGGPATQPNGDLICWAWNRAHNYNIRASATALVTK